MENEKQQKFDVGDLVQINDKFQPWDLQYAVRDVLGVVEQVFTHYSQPVYLVNFTDKKIKQKCFESWLEPVTDEEILNNFGMNKKITITKGKLMEIITDAALGIVDAVTVQLADLEEEENAEGNVQN